MIGCWYIVGTTSHFSGYLYFFMLNNYFCEWNTKNEIKQSKNCNGINLINFISLLLRFCRQLMLLFSAKLQKHLLEREPSPYAVRNSP